MISGRTQRCCKRSGKEQLVGKARDRVKQIYAALQSQLLKSLTAARGRDDTVHPEVFDQLTVMIECVGSGERRQE